MEGGGTVIKEREVPRGYYTGRRLQVTIKDNAVQKAGKKCFESFYKETTNVRAGGYV